MSRFVNYQNADNTFSTDSGNVLCICYTGTPLYNIVTATMNNHRSIHHIQFWSEIRTILTKHVLKWYKTWGSAVAEVLRDASCHLKILVCLILIICEVSATSAVGHSLTPTTWDGHTQFIKLVAGLSRKKARNVTGWRKVPQTLLRAF